MLAELLILATTFGPAPPPPAFDPPIIVTTTITTTAPVVPDGLRRVCDPPTQSTGDWELETCYLVPTLRETLADEPDHRNAATG